MKIAEINIHNYRSIHDMTLIGHDYLLLVGGNNAGKSTVINAIRTFYDDIKWSKDDLPKVAASDDESWVQITFNLTEVEWEGLADDYKVNDERHLTVRRYFQAPGSDRAKSGQSNLYAVVDGVVQDSLFYGAKQVSLAKVGRVLYIPALTTTAEQTKMSGPSPMRNMINFLVKKIASKSPAYAKVTTAFEELNEEAKGHDGFLRELSDPFNAAIQGWNISLDLSVNGIAPEDITKNLVSFGFVDNQLGPDIMGLDRFGHGFQRSVIYELMKLAPSFADEKAPTKKEFNPDFTLILFEEPEVFLHPGQQEVMAYHLQRLAKEEGQQIILTTHSPLFAGKATDDFGRLVRIHKNEGCSFAKQPTPEHIKNMLGQGGMLLNAMQLFVDNVDIPDTRKGAARKMIAQPPQEDIALAEEHFRFQLWLDGERASLFFADKVLLVEGATERGLFNYLLADSWRDLASGRICVIDALGKYNFHRYIALLEAYGIPYGVMLDDDDNKAHHKAINELVLHCAENALGNPVLFASCLETSLGLPMNNRPDKKPLDMLRAVSEGGIAPERLSELRTSFKAALAIH